MNPKMHSEIWEKWFEKGSNKYLYYTYCLTTICFSDYIIVMSKSIENLPNEIEDFLDKLDNSPKLKWHG